MCWYQFLDSDGGIGWLYLDILDSDGCDNALEDDVSLDRKLKDYSSKLLMGGEVGIDLVNDCSSIFWSLMGERWVLI
jgi:hypothetical protein